MVFWDHQWGCAPTVDLTRALDDARAPARPSHETPEQLQPRLEVFFADALSRGPSEPPVVLANRSALSRVARPRDKGRGSLRPAFRD